MTDQNDDVDSTAAITDISRKWKSESSWSRKDEEDSSTIASVPTASMRSATTSTSQNYELGSFASPAAVGSNKPGQSSFLGLLRNDELLEEKKQDSADGKCASVPMAEHVDSRQDMDSAKIIKSEIGDRFNSAADMDEDAPLNSSRDALSPQGQSRRRAMLISIHKELRKRIEKVSSPDPPSSFVPSNTTKSVDLEKKRRVHSKTESSEEGAPLKRSKSDADASSRPTEKPKPPMYAYELFSHDYQRAYQAANRNAEDDPTSQSRLTEMILQRWNEMSSKEKQPYVIRATEDQKNFKQQIEAWNQNHEGDSAIDASNPEGYVAPSVVGTETSQHVETKTREDALVDHSMQKGQKPRGRPKVGYEWDSQTVQWKKQAGPLNRGEKEPSWYTNLQSSPARPKDDATNQPSRHLVKSAKSETIGTEAPSDGTTISIIKKSPKTVPKINSDGTYRKPPGTQPMGYVWNAESGYWESAVDDNMKKLLDFDDEGPRDGANSTELRTSFSGSSKPAGGKKRHYTKDGCIVPNQTLERNRNGTYVRPMGRPLVGYTWNEVRGLWVPNGASSSFSERQNLSSAAPVSHDDSTKVDVDRRHSEPSMKSAKLTLQQGPVTLAPMKKGRKYTPDGCIIPSRIPQLAIDGSYVRPLGRSIVGYTWDAGRGLWAPEGSISQKNSNQPQSSASVLASSSLPRSTSIPVVKKGSKYSSCGRCVGCKTAKNCGICLHCMLIQEAENDGELPSPFYICMQRVCSAPIVNTNHKDEGNQTKTMPDGENVGSADDDSVLESVSDNARGNSSNDDVSDLEDSEGENDDIDVDMANKDS